ncbi:LamG domain-containing protein [Streptomyces sp. NPDC002623]
MALRWGHSAARAWGRQLRRNVCAVTAVGLLAMSPAIITTAPASAAEDSTLDEAHQALAQAQESGQRVEVIGERGEYTTTFANPDGVTMTMEQSVAPVRVAKSGGDWAEPDATLAKGADGAIRPKAATADMVFSGGGDGSHLVKISEAGRAVELGWPGELPTPRLDGARVIYDDVLPDANLIVTATLEGFQQVLEVETPEAARNPALAEINFSLRTTGLKMQNRPGGGLIAVGTNGQKVFQSPAARMWDSSGDTQVNPSRALASIQTADEIPLDASGATEDPVAGPGVGDEAAVLELNLKPDSIAVTPDPGMLTDTPAASFPLYIDPSVEINESERTLLSSANGTQYNFSTGTDGLGVGRCSQKVIGDYLYYCTKGAAYTNRMYFEFKPTSLAGKRVLGAEFWITERHSFSCTPSWVDLERTNPISASTNWPGPTKLDQMGDRSVAAGNAAYCPSQPDAPIKFVDNLPDEPDENLTATVKSFAEGKLSLLTLMLMAKDESDPNGWKRFDDDAVLKVTYVGIPALPRSVGFPSGSGYICSTDQANPTIVAAPKPQVTGIPLTAVGGSVGAHLRIRFRFDKLEGGSWKSGPLVGIPDLTSPSTGFVANLTKQSPTLATALSEGVVYRMKALTMSYYDNQTSFLNTGYTAACYFKVDTSAPKPPNIAVGSPYTNCAVTCTPAGGPNQGAQFTFTPAVGDTNTHYQYKLSTDTTWSTWLPGATVNQTITPTRPGTATLQVVAKDSLGRRGGTAQVEFLVKEGEKPVGQWHFDEATGAAVDTSTTDPAFQDPITLSGASRYAGGRRGELLDSSGTYIGDDKAIRLTGSAQYGATSGPVIDPRASYTISAWARVDACDKSFAAVSQDATYKSPFWLGCSQGKWRFNAADGDKPDGGWTASVLSQDDAALKAWVHVAGVYDMPNKQIRLYVNGKLQGSSSYTSAWTDQGGLQIGRTKLAGSWADYWPGSIDEVTVWQRLTSDYEMGLAASMRDDGSKPGLAKVADWHPTEPGTNTVTDATGNHPLSLLGGAATTADGMVFDGIDDGASTESPVIDDTGSFTVTTHVELDVNAMESKPDGYLAQVVGHTATSGDSAWGIWFKRTGFRVEIEDNELGEPEEVKILSGRWYFGRLNADGTITGVETTAEELSASQVHLTGVHDAQDGTVALYMSNTPQEAGAEPFTAKIGGEGIKVGKSAIAGASQNFLPGTIEEVRLFAGALEDAEHLTQVIGITT